MNAETISRATFLKVAIVILGSILFLLACTPPRQSLSLGPVSPTQDRSVTAVATNTPAELPPIASAQAMSASAQAAPLRATTDELNCTYTGYYWQSHPELWLTDNIIIGRLSYTKEDALAIISGENLDATSNTLREFFAAILNILKGADPSAIEKEIIQISDWLNAHPPGLKLSELESEQSLLLADMLADYNGGEIGPGPCEDEPSTPTPSATFTEMPTATSTSQPFLPSPTPTATEKTRSGGPDLPEEPPTPTPVPTTPAPPATATPRPAATTAPPPATDTHEPTPTIAPTEVPAATATDAVLPPIPTLPPLPTFP